MAAPLAVLFDIDGTLIESGGASTRSWTRAFDECFGVAVNIWDYAGAGMTDPAIAHKSFAGALGHEPDPRELARLLGAYLRAVPDEVAASTAYRVLPGVEQTLSRLTVQGMLLGITTGNLAAAAHAKLARGGLDRYFAIGGYGSDSEDRTELTKRAIERAGQVHRSAIDPGDVFVVGDTPLDVGAAHGASSVAVGVATGQYDVGALSEAGADHVIATMERDNLDQTWLSGGSERTV
jgi:phosphoglycolate phosphatase-like HAD superfamily hydrolase